MKDIPKPTFKDFCRAKTTHKTDNLDSHVAEHNVVSNALLREKTDISDIWRNTLVSPRGENERGDTNALSFEDQVYSLLQQWITREEYDKICFQMGNALGRLKYTSWLDLDNSLSINEVLTSYATWLKKRCILCFETPEYYTFGYASKRGNAQYNERVNERWDNFDILKPIDFFNPKDRGLKTTRMLFLTLTNKSKTSVGYSWKQIGKLWNTFLSNVKKHYGKIYYARCWEAFEKGFPHIHAVIMFEHDFKVFRDNSGTFRIEEKRHFENWWNSFVDIVACYNSDIMFYLGKHNKKFCDSIKTTSSKKHLITLAYCWLGRKRSFSISRGFFSRVHSLGLHYSNQLHAVAPGASKFVGIIFPGTDGMIELEEGWWHKFHKKDLPEWVKPMIEEAKEWTKRRKELKETTHITFKKEVRG